MVAATNQRPYLFCVPGDPKNAAQLERTTLRDDWNKIAPWPANTILRVKIHPGEGTSDVIWQIIKIAATRWVDILGSRLGLQWVNKDENADIRVSFRPDTPNWSCIGVKARGMDASQPTMNFSLGGWEQSRTIYSHQYISQLAQHLFGHAVGLPHAHPNWSEPWNAEALKAQVGAFLADVMVQATGSLDMQEFWAAMQFERPAHLGGANDFREDFFSIDRQTRQLIIGIYPRTMYLLKVAAKDGDEFSTRQTEVFSSHTSPGRPGVFHVKPFPARDPNAPGPVGGISMFNMDGDDHPRVSVDVRWGPTDQEVWLGRAREWDHNTLRVTLGMSERTLLLDASANILAFDKADARIQTGCFTYDAFHDPASRQLLGGEYRENPDLITAQTPRTADISFGTPFKKPPVVLTFISGFDSAYGIWTRIEVSPRDITSTGFVLYLGTWADSKLYNLSASWIAYDADDQGIRSGEVATELNTHLSTTHHANVPFTTPLLSVPPSIFTAFSYLEFPSSSKINIGSTATPDGKEGFSHSFVAADGASFAQLKSSYIVIV